MNVAASALNFGQSVVVNGAEEVVLDVQDYVDNVDLEPGVVEVFVENGASYVMAGGNMVQVVDEYVFDELSLEAA